MVNTPTTNTRDFDYQEFENPKAANAFVSENSLIKRVSGKEEIVITAKKDVDPEVLQAAVAGLGVKANLNEKNEIIVSGNKDLTTVADNGHKFTGSDEFRSAAKAR
jgi:hypothetical protein